MNGVGLDSSAVMLSSNVDVIKKAMDVQTTEHLASAQKFRQLMALLKENEMLVRIGAYQKGSDPELDAALERKEAMDNFLRQSSDQTVPFDETISLLQKIVS